MASETLIAAARDKLLSKACSWLDLRNAKNALTGAAKREAQSRQRIAEHALAEAIEKYRKLDGQH